MAPPKWDDEEGSSSSSSPPPPPVAGRRRFEDEEEDDDVPDEWDAASESDDEETKAAKAKEAEAAQAKATAEAAAQHKSKTQRVTEAQARRKAEAAKAQAAKEEEEEEDPAERRARLKRSEKESDLKHAEDLLGDLSLGGAPGGLGSGPTTRRTATAVLRDPKDPSSAVDLATLPLFKPGTKAQFTELTDTLIPLLTAASKKPAYALWVTDFAKQLVRELSSSDIKRVASGLTAASNAKLKEEKAADKSGKKTKAAKTKTSLVADRGSVQETAAYAAEDYDMGDDDFM